MTYLTEQRLIDFLSHHFDGEIQCNKKLKTIDINCRPDYVNFTSKIIVEFDGYLHYTQSKTQVRDKLKDQDYIKYGYKVIRWPYFVQLSTESIKYYLNEDIDYKQVYPHGFHDSKVVFPADFNSLGLVRYYTELNSLPIFIRSEIESSLSSKDGDFELLYPTKRENLSILP